MIWYVHRVAGQIAYAGILQAGYSEEALDDGVSAELQAFLNPPSKTLAEKLAAGCAITSSGANPDVVGTWALDLQTQQEIAAVATSAAQFGLPRGRPVFNYPDSSGVPHVLTAPELGVLFTTLRDYIDELYETAATLEQGDPADWPVQPVAVA